MHRAGKRFDPEEVWVGGATHGFRPKDADRLKNYACGAIEGLRAIKANRMTTDRSRPAADRMVEYWRGELQKGE